MRSATRVALLALFFLPMASGCLLPTTKVVKNPCPDDTGVRYYRPKPYLWVKPMIVGEQIADGYVTLDHVMLPDFTEEYSIHVKSGLGMNHTSITLDQGWNLTAIDVNIDSKFSENVDALANLMKSVPIPTGGGGETRSMVVRATNVPMGLYEAVISCGPDGKKRLYGFRYVGFMPYEPCPVESNGVQCQNCYSGAVYGLVFEDGAMVFRPLPEIPNHICLERANIKAPEEKPEGVGPDAIPQPNERPVTSEEVAPLNAVN